MLKVRPYLLSSLTINNLEKVHMELSEKLTNKAININNLLLKSSNMVIKNQNLISADKLKYLDT